MFKKRIQSFIYAFQGVQFLLKSQVHAKIHLFFTIAVFSVSIYFQVTLLEWMILLFCIAMVWSLEAMNTAVEQVVDLVSPNYHEKAKQAKDVAAAAVLIAAFFSVIIGLIIFIPYCLASFF